MIEKIQEPISVELIFNSQTKKIFPYHVNWRGKTYQIDKVGLHHFFRQGRTLFHVFSVSCDNLFFRLKLNTDNLHWVLEEIAEN